MNNPKTKDLISRRLEEMNNFKKNSFATESDQDF